MNDGGAGFTIIAFYRNRLGREVEIKLKNLARLFI
jgi:hypothetical protein